MKLKHLNRYDTDAAIAKWLDSHPDPDVVIYEILADFDGLSRPVHDWLHYPDHQSMLPIFDHIRSALIDIIESENSMEKRA